MLQQNYIAHPCVGLYHNNVKHANHHRVATTAQVFSVQWKISLSETVVQSICDANCHKVSKRIKLGKSAVINMLLEVGRGRCNMDQKMQACIKNRRAGGGNISSAAVMGAAERIFTLLR